MFFNSVQDKKGCSDIIDLSGENEKIDNGKYSNENKNSSSGQSSASALDQAHTPVNDTGLSSTSPLCSTPLSRQFWKAGIYDEGFASTKFTIQNGNNYLHIHPMFLHSNATSHKWAFGAIAELLDNAVDEIQNEATFVSVDITTNPRDGSPALLTQDDGGGMDPDAIRRCISFGFSDKKSESSIGKYGNGFKTSSMRLGADVILFSRHLNHRTMTQSIGLLSYTFLTQTGLDRIVVPMVDYEFSTATSTFQPLYLHGKEHFTSNLSVLLQWSPYSSEVELLKQFDDFGYHGTKVIVYNLWFGDDGKLELDFDKDPEDICIHVNTRKIYTKGAWKEINNQHLGNQFHHSLRAYVSILYLRIPESYRIILRGRDVEHHAIVNDLKFRELIMYRPRSGGSLEGEVVTTIGFLKEAPQVSIHGFSVYHKNRLIMPFWEVVGHTDHRSRGIVGVLEANFIEPTHDKQCFERSSLSEKLETRLKDMTLEYWDCHCELVGYQTSKKPRLLINKAKDGVFTEPVRNKSHDNRNSLSNPQSIYHPVLLKRVEQKVLPEPIEAKRQAVEGSNSTNTPHCLENQNANTTKQLKDQDTFNLLMQENRKLRTRCLDRERRNKELNHKVIELGNELRLCESEYLQMLSESRLLGTLKEETIVNNGYHV